MTRNPNWTRDELILALDLYFRAGRKKLDAGNIEVIKLSHILNKLQIHKIHSRNTDFRNPEGVSMKLSNFMSIDPQNPSVGLLRRSKLDQEIWNEFSNDTEALKIIANSIIHNSSYVEELRGYYSNDNYNDEEFVEGRLLTFLHKRNERNSTLITRKKSQVLSLTGRLLCEVCGFDFVSVYGQLGYGFAECHHIVPISNLKYEQKTKLSDLAIVCANCHRMIHKSKPLLTIHELRVIIDQNRDVDTKI